MTLKEIILLTSPKNYRSWDGDRTVVAKVYNRGNGNFPLFKIFESSKVILVNKNLSSKVDIKKLNSVISNDYTVRFVEVNYINCKFNE